MQVTLERLLDAGGHGAFSAPSMLMARGYGYAAEGDALHAALVHAGPHHLVMNLGRHAHDRRAFCGLAGTEHVTIGSS
jgi:L-arabinose isomerase